MFFLPHIDKTVALGFSIRTARNAIWTGFGRTKARLSTATAAIRVGLGLCPKRQGQVVGAGSITTFTSIPRILLQLDQSRLEDEVHWFDVGTTIQVFKSTYRPGDVLSSRGFEPIRELDCTSFVRARHWNFYSFVPDLPYCVHGDSLLLLSVSTNPMRGTKLGRN